MVASVIDGVDDIDVRRASAERATDLLRNGLHG
jgi:hypothetical protein